MADLETGIRDTLLAVSGIAGAVGARVRPLSVSPRDVRPYITYQITNDESMNTLDGDTGEYAKGEFEIGIHADTYDQTMSLSKLIKSTLDNNGETVSGVEFAPIEYDGQSDIEEVTPEGEALPIYLRVQTYRV